MNTPGLDRYFIGAVIILALFTGCATQQPVSEEEQETTREHHQEYRENVDDDL